MLSAARLIGKLGNYKLSGRPHDLYARGPLSWLGRDFLGPRTPRAQHCPQSAKGDPKVAAQGSSPATESMSLQVHHRGSSRHLGRDRWADAASRPAGNLGTTHNSTQQSPTVATSRIPGGTLRDVPEGKLIWYSELPILPKCCNRCGPRRLDHEALRRRNGQELV